MKRIVIGLLSMLLSALFLVPAGPAAVAAPYCGLTWGSTAKSDAGSAFGATLADVRAGRHACYDRIVLDIDGQVDGWDVRYVSVVRADGSGAAVPVAGAADLRIVVRVPAYDARGNPTYHPANPRHLVDVAGFSTFRQVRWAGSFEGQTTIALGVRGRLPFRVFVLDGPGDSSRVVIDVAHRW